MASRHNTHTHRGCVRPRPARRLQNVERLEEKIAAGSFLGLDTGQLAIMPSSESSRVAVIPSPWAEQSEHFQSSGPSSRSAVSLLGRQSSATAALVADHVSEFLSGSITQQITAAGGSSGLRQHFAASAIATESADTRINDDVLQSALPDLLHSDLAEDFLDDRLDRPVAQNSRHAISPHFSRELHTNAAPGRVVRELSARLQHRNESAPAAHSETDQGEERPLASRAEEAIAAVTSSGSRARTHNRDVKHQGLHGAMDAVRRASRNHGRGVRNPAPVIASDEGTNGNGDPGLEWTITLFGGSDDQGNPLKAFAGDCAGARVEINGVDIDQVDSIEWFLPSFPNMFRNYEYTNFLRDPVTGRQAYARVFPAETPDPFAKVTDLGGCAFHWGPVDNNVTTSVFVTLKNGESKTESVYNDIDEPALASTILHSHPVITDCQFRPNESHYIFGWCPSDPAIQIAAAVGGVADHPGNLFYLQTIDETVVVIQSDGLRYGVATGGMTIDAPIEGPDLQLNARYPIGSDPDFPVVVVNRMCPTPVNFGTFLAGLSHCIMVDAPSLRLFAPSGAYITLARTIYQFRTTLMYVPDGGEPVPIGRVDWSADLTVTLRDGENADDPGDWELIAWVVDIPAALAPTDEWPSWVGSAQDYGPVQL